MRKAVIRAGWGSVVFLVAAVFVYRRLETPASSRILERQDDGVAVFESGWISVQEHPSEELPHIFMKLVAKTSPPKGELTITYRSPWPLRPVDSKRIPVIRAGGKESKKTFRQSTRKLDGETWHLLEIDSDLDEFTTIANSKEADLVLDGGKNYYFERNAVSDCQEIVRRVKNYWEVTDVLTPLAGSDRSHRPLEPRP